MSADGTLTAAPVNPAPSLFWEGGDDAAISRYGALGAKRSFIAYLLLGRSVVVHPAYAFQEPRTRELLLNCSPIIAPPKVQLILGNSDTVGEYILTRSETLSSAAHESGQVTHELAQYQALGEELYAISDRLEDKFGGRTTSKSIQWSRDAKFRELVRGELLRG